MLERPTQIEDEQRHVAELVRSFDVPAPESLHRRIESLVAKRGGHRATRGSHRFTRRAGRRPFSSSLGLVGAGAVAAAVVAIALAVGLSGGSSAPRPRP